MRIGIITFPGSLDDVDAARAVRLAGGEPVELWHADADLRGVDAVVLPGGFSYGDHLRAGAIARFAPVMSEVLRGAQGGLPVLGICNGFQVLCEAHLLPGALVRNDRQTFVCRQVEIEVINSDTAATSSLAVGDRLSVPVKHMSGRWFASPQLLDEIGERNQIVFRYAAGQNPNGSVGDVAGVANERGNVVGLMPHPEHAVDALTGSADGLQLFESLVRSATPAAV